MHRELGPFDPGGGPARPALGQGALRRLQRGQPPAGRVNPYALRTLEGAGLSTTGLRWKSWDEFAGPGAPPLDFVFTVCDNAAGEVCPVWPGQPMTAHWGVPDPAAVAGSEAEILKAFRRAMLRSGAHRALPGLPLASIDRLSLQNRLTAIHRRRRPPMTTPTLEVPAASRAAAALGTFERYLSVWVALAIAAGVASATWSPALFQALAALEVRARSTSSSPC